MAPKPKVDDLQLDYDVYNSDDEGDNEGNPEVTDHEDYRDVRTRLQTILRTRQIKDISTAPDPVIAGTKLHERVEDTSLDMRDSKVEVFPPLTIGSANKPKAAKRICACTDQKRRMAQRQFTVGAVAE